MIFAKFISWLTYEPEAPMPKMDLVVLAPLKICYGTEWILSRRILKKINGGANLARKHRIEIHQSPSFRLMVWLHKSFGIGRDKDGMHMLKIRVPAQDYAYLCRVEKGDFTPDRESEIIKFFKPKQGEVVVDIGAHIGRYTILSSKCVGPEGKVVAIEADSDNFDMLNRNVHLNHLDNVVPLNCAAYSMSTKLKLYKPSLDGSIYDTLIPSRASNDSSYVEVNGMTLDSVLHANGIDKVSWIKIDVEGAEFEVLKGASNTLATNNNLALLIEVHDIGDDSHYQNIANFLESYGFKAHYEKVYHSGKERHVIFKREMA